MTTGRRAPSSPYKLKLIVGVLVALSTRATAETADDQRFRVLEQQLREAQEHISQLQRAARERKRSGHMGGHRTPTRAMADGTEAAPAHPVRSDEPVLLLLDALHKSGVISEADYATLHLAIVSKTQREKTAEVEKRVRSGSPMIDEGNPSAVEQGAAGKKRRLPGSLSYAVGKGLTFRSEGGLFEASIRNRMQFRYEYLSKNDPLKDDTSSFSVRRLKTRVRGYVFDPSLRYQFQVSYAGRPTLDDAFLRWRPRPYFALQGGQYQVPFDREQLTSSAFLQFADRTSTDEFFSFGRDQGASLAGHWFGPRNNQLAWSLGIFNGNGGNRSANDNSGHLGVGRLLYMPFGAFKYYSESDVEQTPTPRLGIGAAYAFDSQAESGPKTKTRILQPSRLGRYFGMDFIDKFDISEATADVHFKYRGLSLFGDYYWAEATPNTVTVPSITAQGYDLQVGYFLLPRRLEAAFRYAFTDRDMDAPQSGLREIGGALGYFFFAHNLKLQVDIRDLVDEAPGGKGQETMEYRTQLQAIF